MNISQKCQYALRAVFQLAKQGGGEPVSVRTIAKAQAIPVRFLELILRELRQSGYVESRRGVEGGYRLRPDPNVLTVGEVIRLIDGPLDPVRCLGAKGIKECPLLGKCAFMGLWDRARNALAGVYDTTTFQQLLEEEEAHQRIQAMDFCI